MSLQMYQSVFIKQKPFHVSPTNVQVIKEQMQTVMKESLCEPSTSSCAAPCVVEKKVIRLPHKTL